MEALFAMAVIEHHIETARESNDELVLLPEGVPVAVHAARHIINPIGALDVEGNVSHAFNHREIASRVADFRQFNNMWLKLFHVSWRSD